MKLCSTERRDLPDDLKEAADEGDIDEEGGQCMRYPPELVKPAPGTSELHVLNWSHPAVTAHHWCGEWVRLELRPCKECGRTIKVGRSNHSSTREFCSGACKQKDHRRKVVEAKRRFAAGESVEEIARAIRTTVDAINNWLNKIK